MSVPWHKLVGNRIPEIIQSDGRCPVIRVLDEASYRQALPPSLPTRPPALPPRTFPASRPTCWKSSALTATAGMSWTQLLSLADDKRGRRDGFEKRISLESID